MAQIETPERSFHFRIKLLGTPSLEWGGQPFSLSRKQARAMLYVLGETLAPVSRDRLIFLFWPDTSEVTARRNLSRVLSYIRKSLPHSDILQLNKESIRLNPERVWSDAAHFTDLAQLNSPACQEAMVALYDGLFLFGFDLPHNPEFDSWLTIQQQGYEDRYLAVLKNLIQTKFSDQDYLGAIDYAQEYLTIDEVAEDIHQQLIRLYAASGDRGAAMHQFETCTLILERELGVEPLPETRNVYEVALSGKTNSPPALSTKPAWTILPSLDLPLIGRQTAWNELENAYRQHQGGGVILISGEPGIGKSRLLQEFATSKTRLVLNGNCHASTQMLPYQPIAQALRQALTMPQLWQGIQPIWLTEVSRLLPEMGEYFSDLPQLIDVEPDQAQARLYESLSRSILGLSDNASMLLCLDDLQWVDEATAGWLTYLANRLAGSGLCILATCRVEEKGAIGDFRGAFNRVNLLAEISLAGLEREVIQAILAGLPDPPAKSGILAERIENATGGNPFFVLETIRNLLENNLLVAPPSELPLADTVQDTIQRRLEGLTPVARQLLEASAVLSPDLDFVQLQKTAGRSELEVADGLDELVDHQLLIDGEYYRFKHDLIYQVAYQGLSPWRRKLLHRRAAELLLEFDRSHQDGVAAQIARHYDASGEVEKAIHYYHEAAVLARRLYAYDEAISYLEQAINLSSEIALEWPEVTLYYELLGENLKITAQYEAARQAYSDCLDRIPGGAYLQRVKFQTKLADIFENLNLFDKAEDAYDRALTLLNAHSDDQSLAWQQAWLEIHLERWGLMYLQAKPNKMEALQKDIKPVLEKVGSPDQQVRYFGNLVSTALRRERYAVSEQTVRIAKLRLQAEMETSDPARVAFAKFRWGFVLLWSGDLVGAVGPLSEALQMAEETGRLVIQCRCLIYLTCLYRLRGDVSGARSYAECAFEIAQQLNSDAYIGGAYGNLAWLDWRDQKFDLAERKAVEALSIWGDYQYPFKWLAHCVLTAIYLDRDQLEQAIESVNVMLDPKQQRLPDDLTAALKQCLQSWEVKDVDSTLVVINQALELAKKWAYL